MAHRRMDSTSDLLASGYTSTMIGIAGFSALACVSLLMAVSVISNLEPGTLPGADGASAMRSLRF